MTTPDTTITVFERPVECIHCGYYVSPHETLCPRCEQALTPSDAPPRQPTTGQLTRPPSIVPGGSSHNDCFDTRTSLILQFLPSADCKVFTLDSPLILGRGNADKVVDLTNYQAERHGISRQHCVLQRQGDFLTVTDLDSMNSTYLNDKKLIPHQAEIVSDGDRLILGTLHIILSFRQLDG